MCLAVSAHAIIARSEENMDPGMIPNFIPMEPAPAQDHCVEERRSRAMRAAAIQTVGVAERLAIDPNGGFRNEEQDSRSVQCSVVRPGTRNGRQALSTSQDRVRPDNDQSGPQRRGDEPSAT